MSNIFEKNYLVWDVFFLSAGGLFEGGLFDDTPMPDVPAVEGPSTSGLDLDAKNISGVEAAGGASPHDSDDDMDFGGAPSPMGGNRFVFFSDLNSAGNF